MKRPTRFRILIVGKANAGKTTILRRLCRAADDEMPLVNGQKASKHRLGADPLVIVMLYRLTRMR